MIFAEEWPLMSFTLISQLAIGMFVILMLLKTTLGSKDNQVSAAVNKGFTWVGPLTFVALILSVFHLGDPFGAPRSIMNLASSWLSREIITAGGFFALWFVFWFLLRQGKESNALGWLTGLVGLAAVFSMASIYSSSVIPAWDDVNTYLSFYGATFAMGAAGAATALVVGLKGASIANALKGLNTSAYLGILAVILPLVYLPVFTSGLKDGDTATATSAQVFSESMGMVLGYGGLSLVGAGLLLFALRKGSKEGSVSSGTIYLALGLVLVGQFLGRYLFYAMGIPPIIGTL